LQLDIKVADKRQLRLQSLENLITRLQIKLKELEKLSNNYAWARLTVFTIGFILTTLSFSILGKIIGSIVLFLSIISFFTVVYLHFQLEKSLKRNKIWLEIKSQHRARMQLDWDGIPQHPVETLNEFHPFATDLDIIGKKSLFRLMDISITVDGSKVLLNWLTGFEADLDKILERQSIIKELTGLHLFRDKFLLETYILSNNPFQKWSGNRILNWVSSDNLTDELKKVLNIASILLIASYLLLFLSFVGINPLFWKVAFAAYAFHFFSNNAHTKSFFKDAISIEMELRKINVILQRLEKFNFSENINLEKFCEPFRRVGLQPSYYFRRIKNLVASASIQSNPAVWILSNAIFPWDFFHGYRLKKYKAQIAGILPVWLEKLYQLEAMISLANFAYLNPGYVFPEINSPPKSHSLDLTANGGGLEEEETFSGLDSLNICPIQRGGELKLLNVTQVGHPLLPVGQKVCNDYSMDKTGNLIIITGSNMAGKSTFLRTLGINLCLAYAGGPVNAESFSTVLFRIFTCIKVSDSVTDGFSYFYAEVKRLKALLDELEKPHRHPLFFLVDEIFRGTNNRERLTGSRSYIHALAGRNGVGAISTHDLELIKLEEIIPEITNFHFRDEIIDGKMAFDYKLHKGPCPTTNALKIMKMEGLPVEFET
jgi:hypothetical protein